MIRTAVLIDGGYLSKIFKNYFNSPKINLELFSENLCIDCERIQTFYYNCMPYQSRWPTYEERRRYAAMDRFISVIRGLDKFTVKLGRLLRLSNGKFQQKGVDVVFALDLVELCTADNIDKAIIVSGDSDFVPAVERANALTVITQNAYHREQFSYHLRDSCIESRVIDQALIDSSILTFESSR